MSERIEVGDLVQVVRGGCSQDRIGNIFVVAEICQVNIPCFSCGTFHDGKKGMLAAFESTDSSRGYELSRLRRIPPLTNLESITERKEVTA